MSQSVKAIRRKALKQGVQEYYDHYFAATELYNEVLYEHRFELMEAALTYHMNIMNDLKNTFTLLKPIEESVALIGLEKSFFKPRTERLILDNYYALQDLRELYKELEQQFYTLKTAALMVDDNDDTD